MAPAGIVSIQERFHGMTVLLTGATGCVGGLLLEALLRTTSVKKVYVLLRSKGNQGPQERLQRLLQTSIFHKVREQEALLQKVEAMHGDISLQQLGLDASSAQTLQSEVQVILHTAADIRLEADILTALRANYMGTAAILQLAGRCSQLRALVHTSSCFVNMNQPRSSIIHSKVYPLTLGDRVVPCQEIVQDIMSLPAAAAEVRAAALGQRWGFPNNYTLSKHLAEQLVQQHHQQYDLPICIVRPSLVCAVLYEPIPGHIGNWAGPIGASAALALGFYHSLSCVSSQPLHVWDIMPADLVVNSILAAAAAVAAGLAGGIAVCGNDCSDSSSSDLLIVHSSSSSTYPMTLMEGWNAALEFMAAHPPKMRLTWGLPGVMTPSFRPDPAAVRRNRYWIAFKVRLACLLLKLFGMRAAAARLRNGFEALCVYGTSKTDKDLVFCASTLEALEVRMLQSEQQQYPLIMRPGMPLPRTGVECSSNTSSTVQGAQTPEAADAPTAASRITKGPQESVLTWRRYFHTQMAAVYSALYRMRVPRIATGSDPAAAIEHDFIFTR